MRKFVVLACTIALGLSALLFAPMANAATTPAVEQVTVPTSRPAMLTFFSAKPITQVQSSMVSILPYDYGEMIVTTDHTAVAGAPNTATVLLEFSNDGVNWAQATGALLLNANATDVTTYSVASLAGRMARVRVSSVATSTYPFTLTASMVAK
jgi:hypothetical protein